MRSLRSTADAAATGSRAGVPWATCVVSVDQKSRVETQAKRVAATRSLRGPPPSTSSRPQTTRRQLSEALGASRRHELPVPDAFEREQLVGDGADPARRPAEGHDLEARVRVQVNVERRGDRAIAVVLDVGELVLQRARAVLVDQRQNAHRLARPPRPFLLDELGAQQVAHELAAVRVAAAGAQAVQRAHQPGRQRDGKPDGALVGHHSRDRTGSTRLGVVLPFSRCSYPAVSPARSWPAPCWWRPALKARRRPPPRRRRLERTSKRYRRSR